MLEMSHEQRRQLIDVAAVFDVWRNANMELRRSYSGTLRWRRVKANDYLERIVRKSGNTTTKSLGVRSAETEAIKLAHDKARSALKQRIRTSSARLAEMARVSKALRLDRLASVPTRLLQLLDQEGLLGQSMFVVGTNALHAYEARAGVFVSSDLLATDDLDLLWDTRRQLSLVLSSEISAKGMMSLLRSVDESFAPTSPRSFRAANDRGYLVDLVQPRDKDFRRTTPQRISQVVDDLFAVGIDGLEWLINSPKFEEVVVGHGGQPVRMVCVDPRIYALHKRWLAKRTDRSPKQKPRDDAQAALVVELCARMNLEFTPSLLTALPTSLRRLA